MTITPQRIPDVFLLRPSLHQDERGYFVETYRSDLLNQAVGYTVDFVQENESFSTRGVLRGLHFQSSPCAQAKLVRVTQGKVLDVAVDIRASSPFFGQYVAMELSADNGRQLFIPRGFAHGFIVLSSEAKLIYKVDNFYSPYHDRGIAFDDPDLDIDWLLSRDEILLSDKDRKHPPLSAI